MSIQQFKNLTTYYAPIPPDIEIIDDPFTTLIEKNTGPCFDNLIIGTVTTQSKKQYNLLFNVAGEAFIDQTMTVKQLANANNLFFKELILNGDHYLQALPNP